MTTGAAHRPRIGVVDDHPELVENLVEILESQGYSVSSAGTCAAGAALARSGLDVALVDLKLPDGDGTSLARRIKELNPESEVILLTGFATVESAAAAVRSGACAYLIKPCATADLLLTVEQALRHVRLQVEKKELARRAQVAEKLAAVGTMTAGLSHEIRNPLNAAALQLAVLERRIGKLAPELRGPLLEPLTLVRDEIRRLDHVLEDFLQFARPIQFVPRPIDLRPLLDTVAAFLMRDVEQRGLSLSCACDDALVSGDEGRLRQVFMNLALNALDATPRGGSIRVACRPAGDFVVATVEDSGPGIPPELQERIFEPFFTTKPNGSGLGLPIVHAIIIQHGGTISVHNAPGSGARFTLKLPRARSS